MRRSRRSRKSRRSKIRQRCTRAGEDEERNRNGKR